MPAYQLTTKARDKARKIREVADAYRRERVERREAQSDTRDALRSTSASHFLMEVER